MKVIGMRFCRVSEKSEAAALAEMLTKLGLTERELGMSKGDEFQGAVFPVGSEQSWVEI